MGKLPTRNAPGPFWTRSRLPLRVVFHLSKKEPTLNNAERRAGLAGSIFPNFSALKRLELLLLLTFKKLEVSAGLTIRNLSLVFFNHGLKADDGPLLARSWTPRRALDVRFCFPLTLTSISTSAFRAYQRQFPTELCTVQSPDCRPADGTVTSKPRPVVDRHSALVIYVARAEAEVLLFTKTKAGGIGYHLPPLEPLHLGNLPKWLSPASSRTARHRDYNGPMGLRGTYSGTGGGLSPSRTLPRVLAPEMKESSVSRAGPFPNFPSPLPRSVPRRLALHCEGSRVVMTRGPAWSAPRSRSECMTFPLLHTS